MVLLKNKHTSQSAEQALDSCVVVTLLSLSQKLSKHDSDENILLALPLDKIP